MGQNAPAVAVIQEMVSPALFIAAAATLLNLAFARISRIREHLKVLVAIGEAWGRERKLSDLSILKRRARFAERAVFLFFVGLTLFAATCLFVSIDHNSGGHLSWLPVGAATLGVLSLVLGTGSLLGESRLATHQLEHEISRAADILG